MPTHLITGVAGQDGVLLARHLRVAGGHVVGTVRPGSASYARNAPYLEGVEVVEHDLRDQEGFRRVVERVEPDEVYNLAAISSVRESWEHPEDAEQTNGAAVAGLLAVLRDHPQVRFLQAGSAEESVGAAESPYSRAKSAAHAHVAAARDDGLFACVARLHIHESPVRDPGFVVRKVTRAVAELRLGRREELTLGNLDVKRDWGAAVDTVRALRLMLTLDEPADLEVATGVVHSLDDVVGCAFDAAGLGEPARYVRHDPGLVRPVDTPVLLGDTAPLRSATGWRPHWSFEDTIEQMVRVDLQRLESGVEADPAYLPAESGRG